MKNTVVCSVKVRTAEKLFDKQKTNRQECLLQSSEIPVSVSDGYVNNLSVANCCWNRKAHDVVPFKVFLKLNTFYMPLQRNI